MSNSILPDILDDLNELEKLKLESKTINIEEIIYNLLCKVIKPITL